MTLPNAEDEKSVT